eukprot:10347_5
MLKAYGVAHDSSPGIWACSPLKNLMNRSDCTSASLIPSVCAMALEWMTYLGFGKGVGSTLTCPERTCRLSLFGANLSLV